MSVRLSHYEPVKFKLKNVFLPQYTQWDKVSCRVMTLNPSLGNDEKVVPLFDQFQLGPDRYINDRVVRILSEFCFPRSQHVDATC